MARNGKLLPWVLWGALSLAATLALGQKLISKGSSSRLFLPGKTTHGHYQIELACAACHTKSFASGEDIQSACVGCHAAELEEAKDAHPMLKFTDPRNADRVAVLDARHCVACHAEHMPERTHTMGLSLPEDYCYHCHQEIFQERASHLGLGFDTCADGGCHNFHDNRALYEDFLLEHAEDPWLGPLPIRPLPQKGGLRGASALKLADADGPSSDGEQGKAWEASAHARSGINCSGCHDSSEVGFQEAVPVARCQTCHAKSTEGWLASRHGMRLSQELPPMSVAEARLPMKASAVHEELSCGSCHGDHGTELEAARYEACVSCHNDSHTLAYEGSPHFRLLELERAGRIARGGGVSCATCHMPSQSSEDGSHFTQHNQNANLRPNEKMIRSVCQDCHGVPFAIDALADAALVAKNFPGPPSLHVKSVDWAAARDESKN